MKYKLRRFNTIKWVWKQRLVSHVSIKLPLCLISWHFLLGLKPSIYSAF